ncbi:glycosyl hydrolase [Pyronema omphalodes]|nr:glycosyl hydrolase [Pyronema omphalodes]
MKIFNWILPAASLFSLITAQSCPTILDNFSQWTSNKNSLGGWTSDDNSMASISASRSGTLLLTPKRDGSSYFYSSLPSCTVPSFDAVSYLIKGPSKGRLAFELQVSQGCTGTTSSRFVAIDLLTDGWETVTVALKDGEGLKAVVWSGMSQGEWEIGEISLKCKGTQPVPSITIVPVPSATSTGAAGTSTAVSFTSTATTAFSTSSIPIVTPSPQPTTACSNLLIDDWQSQSRLTFLGYNALLKASGDDGTMKSILVNDNRVTFTPKEAYGGFFYSIFGCINATNLYGGISMKIKAPAGTTFAIELQTNDNCLTSNHISKSKSSTELGWTFDGEEKLYDISFGRYPGLNTGNLVAIVLSSFSNPVTLGPMSFYCGSTASEIILPSSPAVTTTPVMTVPAPTATNSPLVIDTFTSPSTNSLGESHGSDYDASVSIGNGSLTINFPDSDYNYYTRFSDSCKDMRIYESSYLHIVFNGSTKFSIGLLQHNKDCNPDIAPFPETWDDVYAARYAKGNDIYVPFSHFKIDKARVIGIKLHGFTPDITVFKKIELVPSVPSSWKVPSKVETAPLVFACTRPNSFAFAIDDGIPEFSQTVMKTIKDSRIKVTFFTVGVPLLDMSNNFTNVYRDMLDDGHQVALHSFTHPKMESLEVEDIDWEIEQDIKALNQTLGIESQYFRPPFGNVGAKFRERVAAKIPGGKIINWSVDVEDWLWAQGPNPEKQLEAFKRDVEKGGNLVVLHYLYPSTVQYLQQFIDIAKATGKDLMRVDQCMEDPDAPPLPTK